MANQPSYNREFGTSNSILMFPEDYKAFAQTFDADDTTATEVDGRTLIEAGTVWPANDATARGIVLNTLDVTDGAQSGAVCYAGSFREDRLPAALEADAKAALPRVTIFPEVTP